MFICTKYVQPLKKVEEIKYYTEVWYILRVNLPDVAYSPQKVTDVVKTPQNVTCKFYLGPMRPVLNCGFYGVKRMRANDSPWTGHQSIAG